MGERTSYCGKEQVGEYRMTMDLRVIYAVTVTTTWLMPHLEVVMVNLMDLKCYLSLYRVCFNWQCVDEDSRDYFTVVTSKGLFTVKLVRMGSADEVVYAQQVDEEVMRPVLGKGVTVMAKRCSRVCKYRCPNPGYIRRGLTEV